MNKAIVLICMASMLMVGALASPVAERVYMPQGNNNPIVIGESASEARDAKCAAANSYLFENALQDNVEYRVNYQTCKVEQKVTAQEVQKCGYLSKWINGVRQMIDNRFGGKQPKLCMKKNTDWIEIN